MPTLRVPGQRELDVPDQASALARRASGGRVTVKHSVRVDFARAGHEPAALDAATDDVVELELDGDVRLWSRLDRLEEDFGFAASRGAGGDRILDLGAQLPLGGPSRGAGGWVIRALKVLDIDLAGGIADIVRDHVEGRLQPGPGLYRCSPADPDDLARPRKPKASGPTLVWLHGTGSSFQASFAGLWDGPGRMRELAGHYDGDILAFQHRTLSESPIENGRDLLRALAEVLPKGAELHLVSHSRGGLVGELLARGSRLGGGSFDAADLRLFKGRPRDVEALTELRDLLDAQRYRVSRFVRVACPARGTTLAGRRLDRYLSIVLNVLDHVPGLGQSVLAESFASLLAAVVKKRTEPEELPGLEAMMPDSPLVRLLNRSDVRTDSLLRILGGDVEGTGFWGRLKAFVSDLYYREDHDLVVNTPAMFGGTERVRPTRYWIDTGGRVSHFNYFSNADTAARLLSALSDESAADFHEVEVPLGAVSEDDYRKRAPLPQPVVFVLPGTMGSTLTVAGRRVWIDRVGLARGGMSDLVGPGKGVAAEGLVEGSYRDLVRHLAATHDVVPFPYDWRQPLAASAEALRKALDARLDALEGTNQPIRLLAHSMGGLVVRSLLGTAAGRATWQRMCRHPGARLVMLGTPTGGSHAIGAMLMGRDRLVRQLALLDLRHSYGELLAIVAGFDGALQLLPHRGTLDLFDPEAWARLHLHDTGLARGIGKSKVDPSAAAGVDWSVPSTAGLEAARAARDALQAVAWDPARMIYVAGVAEETPCDIVVDEQAPAGRRVTVLATRRGDGRVPWATGIPEALGGQTYYMDAVHGDLANTEESFAAIVDLLANGATTKLSRTPPAARGGGPDVFPLREPALDAFPDEQSIAAAAMGGRRGRKPRRTAARVTVRVVHGNLVFARHPVMVGHYREDVFVGAEAFLDRQLGGRLRELQKLDLYPGAIGTATAVLNDGSKPGGLPGAIVAGLGTVGELTPGALIATLGHALTLYAAERVGIERRRRQDGASPATGTTLQLGLTTLLVGGGMGGVTLADSIHAILRAVQAANSRQQAAAGRDDSLTARIATVDICELYEDRAIQAARELNNLTRVADFRNEFVFESVLATGGGGQRRPTFDEPPGWWQRVRIARQPDGALKFENVTERARAEATLLPTQQSMVRGLLERAVRSTATDLELSGTLFELLVPRPVKEQAPDRRPLILILDETSATLPWELMHDRWDAESRPLSVDRGLVRQFVTSVFRPRPARAPRETALVIGDPPLDGSEIFQQLPGAAAEAAVVGDTLREHGFETTLLTGAAAQWPAVLNALYGGPHRVLHIAAHGVYEFPTGDGKTVTGVVLGKGAYLTAAEFDQLRFVPDFVFINCCHLGHGGEYGRTVDVSFPRLAANVAQQFIRMGARAVVAAGWAVDDQAAKEFARVLYGEMLKGREFGRAVQIARQEIYTRYGSVNTWGAYQCYGDPGFLLGTGADESAPEGFVAELELRYAVRHLADRVRGDAARQRELLAQLERWIATAQPEWLASGATGAAIAEAYAKLGRFEEAVAFYERALMAHPASARIEAAEQLANLLARTARANRGRSRKSMTLLKSLSTMGVTYERQSLIGGTAKVLAIAERGEPRRKALREMTGAYQSAYELAVARKADNAWYPLANAVAGRLAMSWQPGGPSAAALGRSAEMRALRDYAVTVAANASTFWEYCLAPDVAVLDAAIEGTLGARARSDLAAAYRDAVARAGTPHEMASATGQIEFLSAMAGASTRKTVVALSESLAQLAAMLKAK